MSRPLIRPYTWGDELEVAAEMRPEDVQEIWHASRSTPLESLQRGLQVSSDLHAVEYRMAPIALLGVVGVRGVAGAPWMLATPDMKHCAGLLRECRRMVDGWAEEYGYLTNAVWQGNSHHIDWLNWLGFTFDGSDIRNGETFLHFHRRHPCVNPQPS